MTAHAPRLFRSLGFDVTVLAADPDGRNINFACGSTHPEALAAEVLARNRQIGVAFDGDGDRAIYIAGRGRIVDGDAVLLMCARQMQAEGRLRGGAVVATVMSNLGLEAGLRESGIDLVRCPVGDKYVMEELVARDLALGGEQSGHIIFADQLYTGDGLITALNVLRTMAATGRDLADLADDLQRFPQVLVNVRVRRRVDLQEIPAVSAELARVEAALGREGRLLVRYSGTEPLLRIMLEGRDAAAIQTWADEIAAEVRTHLS
jgi:phosphoglucosamine mutase